ncbi:anti-sigma factor [Alloalcanivorax mobilis]|uniref:anti-sigma factor n=1 Tax=Alloalcanivorax mobilis TaxID=2019569 RepID=UPI000C76499E|nr:anti-sigma factor [Alloalcanivorax mobilis]
MIPDDPHDQQLLIAEYVLGLCRGEQNDEVERWLERDPDAAAMARQWREHWVAAVELLDPERVPARIWREIRRRTGNDEPWWRRGWGSAPLWRSVSAALAVTVLVLALVPAGPAPVTYTVVLQAPGEAAKPGWRITVSADGDLNLTPLVESRYQPDRSVQFWTLADPAQGPRSLGLIQPGHSITIPASRIGDVQPGQLFELTLEPRGGSPASRPTGPVLFIGRAVEI